MGDVHACGSGLGDGVLGDGNAEIARESSITGGGSAAIHEGLNAFAGDGVDLFSGGWAEVALFRGAEDSTGERVLRCGARGRRRGRETSVFG